MGQGKRSTDCTEQVGGLAPREFSSFAAGKVKGRSKTHDSECASRVIKISQKHYSLDAG